MKRRPGIPGILLPVIEGLSGFLLGSVLGATLVTALDPLIVLVIILATAVAILDFADYMPAFSLAYFAGYVLTFLYPFGQVYGDLRIGLFLLGLAGLFSAVAAKAKGPRDSL